MPISPGSVIWSSEEVPVFDVTQHNECHGGEIHCWHDTGRLLASDPPYAVMVCCWCGLQRTVQRRDKSDLRTHGRHAPGYAEAKNEPERTS